MWVQTARLSVSGVCVFILKQRMDSFLTGPEKVFGPLVYTAWSLPELILSGIIWEEDDSNGCLL